MNGRRNIMALAAWMVTGLSAAEPSDLLQPFLKNYCIQCHGAEQQKGDRRFDQLTGDFTKLAEAEAFQEILDQLNLGEMPPKSKKQPAPAELKRVVTHLTGALARARATEEENSGKVVLRRLNRAEYRNTIRDLFDHPVDGGFDDLGSSLVFAPLCEYCSVKHGVANLCGKIVRQRPLGPDGDALAFLEGPYRRDIIRV